MAVVTARLVRCRVHSFDAGNDLTIVVVQGKRLSICVDNTLERHLLQVLGAENVFMIGSLDDQGGSAIKFRVLRWEKVVERSMEIIAAAAAAKTGQLSSFWIPVIPTTTTTTNTHPTDSIILDNTISVTGKGSVIVRFSWEKPLQWDDSVSRGVLDICSHLCNVLVECC
jgi:hypothetical protein